MGSMAFPPVRLIPIKITTPDGAVIFIPSQQYRCQSDLGPHRVGRPGRKLRRSRWRLRRSADAAPPLAGASAGAGKFPKGGGGCQPPTSKKKDTLCSVSFFLEATPGFEPGNQGFADPCLTTWLCRHIQGAELSSSPISICTPAARYSPRGPAGGGCLLKKGSRSLLR